MGHGKKLYSMQTTLQASNCYSCYHYFRSSSLQSHCSSDNTDEEQETNNQEFPLCHNGLTTVLKPITARSGPKWGTRIWSLIGASRFRDSFLSKINGIITFLQLWCGGSYITRMKLSVVLTCNLTEEQNTEVKPVVTVFSNSWTVSDVQSMAFSPSTILLWFQSADTLGFLLYKSTVWKVIA